MSLSLSSLLSRQAAPAQQAAAPSSDLQGDALVRQAWSLTQEDWAGATDQQRNFYRWNLTKAPNFS